MNSHTVYLPFPSSKLSPNARLHWARLAAMKKSCRRDYGLIAKLSGLGKINADTLSVTITFFPPDNRRRDLDNMLASLKSGLDGIADVCGIDDHKWTLSVSKAATIERNGMVKLELNWIEREAKAA